jgi:sugar phosphate isomerase/epimerase
MSPSRRRFLAASAPLAAGVPLAAGLARAAFAAEPPSRPPGGKLKLALAAYSYRKFLTGERTPAMTLQTFADRAAALQVDGVELTSYYFPETVTPEYVAGLKRHCYILGLDIVGCPVRNTFTYPAGAQRDKEIAHVRRWIDIAADLGSPSIRIFAGDLQTGQTAKEAQANCVECIEACAETAARRGVLLALENHHGVVADPEGLLAIVRAVRSDWCGINLDTGNFRTADPYADLAKCAPYAVTVQLKTEVRPGGGKPQEADLPRLVRILKDAGYRGYVTLEYEAAEDELVAVPKALDRLRALL